MCVSIQYNIHVPPHMAVQAHVPVYLSACMCGPNGMPQAKPPLGHHGQTDLFNNTNKNQ